MFTRKISVLILIGLLSTAVDAGPMSAGICYAGCAAVTVACFSAAGATFGATPLSAIAATPALAACNTAFGKCESSCVAALWFPIP